MRFIVKGDAGEYKGSGGTTDSRTVRAARIDCEFVGKSRGGSAINDYSMLNQKSQNPGVVMIKKLCDGFQITVRDFFESALFDTTEQEIQ